MPSWVRKIRLEKQNKIHCALIYLEQLTKTMGTHYSAAAAAAVAALAAYLIRKQNNT